MSRLEEQLAKTDMQEKMLYALEHKTHGIVSAACRYIGIKPITHFTWLSRDEKYRAEVEHVMEAQKDFVELAYLKAIEKGDTQSMRHYLDAKCKERGYGRQNIAIANYNDQPFQVSSDVKISTDDQMKETLGIGTAVCHAALSILANQNPELAKAIATGKNLPVKAKNIERHAGGPSM